MLAEPGGRATGPVEETRGIDPFAAEIEQEPGKQGSGL